MGKVMNMPRNRIRAQLLTTASALVLTVSVCVIGTAEATDADQPEVWVEFGGQFQQYSGQGNAFAPPFVTDYDWGAAGLSSPASIQAMHVFSYGGEASISFQPSGSDWLFSAGITYGRSHGSRHDHDQPVGPTLPTIYPIYEPGHGFHCCGSSTRRIFLSNYEDTRATNNETHLVLDFQAGKDVGLGMFGHGSTSTISAGVRFAQFRSRSNVNVTAREDTQFYNYYTNYPSYPKYVPVTRFHKFTLYGNAARSFKGIGPSLAWKSTVPIAGNEQDGEISVDWGVNAALLFGRQKTVTKHGTSGDYFRDKYGHSPIAYPPPVTHTRVRNVMVPNVGGFAGLSYRYSDAKLSLGYRADMFFGAIDAGIDTRKAANRAFYGPFASISIGLGD